MTYKEIKRRLSKCERLCKSIREQDLTNAPVEVRQQVQKDLKALNESITKYKKLLLLKEEKTYILTPKSGKPTAASLGDDEVDALKDADDIAAIKAADGEEIKEQDGIEFSIDETKAIAKKVGKAVAKSLKAVGDEIERMKAHRLEPNSFDIHVEYKNGQDDEFSFYISDDTLHLVDFSFDKELVDVGVKPSGEAIVHVDHLANELQKHFKSLSEDVNEMNYSNYKEPKHFDICPGAEALRDKLIDGGKSPEELGEWTYRHDQLFKLEKDVLKSKEANIKHVNAAKKLRAAILHLSRDLGIDADDVAYLKGHVDKIEDVRMGKDVNEGEGDDHHYIKVSRRDYKKAMSILDKNVDPTYVKMDVVDDDGAGNVVIYFIFRHEYGFDDMYDDPEGKENPELYQEPDEDPHGFMYDVVMDLQAQDIDVVDHSADLDEAVDHNDPVLMRARVAKMRANDMKKLDALKKSDKRNAPVRAIIAKLKAKRAEVEREMENDPGIEPEGGPVADKYGDMLNKIDNAIEKAASKLVKEEDDDYETDYVKRRKEDDDYYEDPDYYKEGVSEGTDLYDRNGIQITRFSGGSKGLMLQINYGGKYIHVPADEFATLARAMQSVIGDIRDMTLQMPRKNYPKNMGEGVAKIQKAHGLVVAKMKELAKQYKGGDKSVVGQLKDLTAKKKALEAQLDKAVSDKGRGQQLAEVTEDEVQDAIYELRNLIDEIEAKGEEAREVVRQVFPNELSRLDAYGAFNNMYSANRYDVTLGGFVDRLEEEGFEIEDGEVFTNESKEKEGEMAASKGKKYSENPYEKGTKDHLAWSKGHNSSRAQKLSLANEGMTVVGHTPEEQKKNAEELVAKAKELGIEANIRYSDNPGYEDQITMVDIGKNGLGSHPELDAIQDRQFADYDKNKPKDNKPSFKPKKLKKLKLGGKTYQIGDFDPNDDGRIESIEKYPNGYFIQGGVYSDYGDGDGPKQGYGYAIDLKGNEMDEEDLEGMYEGKYKSDAQRKAVHAAKDDKKNEAAPGFKHDCAAKVVHEKYGAGTCIPEKHTLVKEGSKYVVTHYDVLFESGKTVEDIPVSELEIKTQKEHWHKGYKKKKK